MPGIRRDNVSRAPDGARPQRGIEVVIQGRHVLIEPGDMGRDVGAQALRRVFEAVLLGRPQGDELPPPRQESPQLFRLRIRERTGRRAHRLRKVGDGPGIEGINFGELPGGFGKVPDLTGGDHDDGEGHRRQRGHYGALVAPRSFAHHALWRHGLEACDQGGNPRRIIRDRPTFPCGTQGNIKLRFGNIDTNTDLRDRHDNS
jgi:hypothetical protein